MKLEDIKTVAVIGAGDMGHGIAEVCAIAGYEVFMKDIKQEFIDKGMSRIEASLKKLASKDRLKEEVSVILSRVHPSLDYKESLENAQLVIEAVPEIMSLKKSVFKDLDEGLPAGSIIASNTSNMSITELATVTNRPELVVGMHFFNPVMLMKTVEIIKGGKTNQETMDIMDDFTANIKKMPIPVLKDVPGFIINRVQAPTTLLLGSAVEKGVITPNQIDALMQKVAPMGPFVIMDYVGLDVVKHGSDYFAETLDPAFAPPAWLNKLFDEGKLGKKTGSGIYDWSKGRPELDMNDVTDKISMEDMLIVQINEAARIIEAGVTEHPGDVDLAIQNGTGNAAGIFSPLKANRQGVIDRLNYWADELGIEYLRPVEALKTMEIPKARKALKARKKARAARKEAI
ncbi:MAG: 3-hydroxyacyl-CoA dehydrogenase family protein [archaeon]|nr:3-hydroxyacyl-CoA dehydrogenase family protein [archaeon]